MRRCVWSRNIKNGCSIYIYIYIYIYDISRLRVKDQSVVLSQVRYCVDCRASLAPVHITAVSMYENWPLYFCFAYWLICRRVATFMADLEQLPDMSCTYLDISDYVTCFLDLISRIRRQYVLYQTVSTRVMLRLTTGTRSEKCVVRAISSLCERHRVYLHKPRQYSIAYYTPRSHGIAYCC